MTAIRLAALRPQAVIAMAIEGHKQRSWSKAVRRRAARPLERFRVRVVSVAGRITRLMQATAQAGLDWSECIIGAGKGSEVGVKWG